MTTWQPIESAPHYETGLHSLMLASFYQPRDDEGNPSGPAELSWAHCVHRTSSGWMLNSAGFSTIHGNASFPVSEKATHWMRVPALQVGDA